MSTKCPNCGRDNDGSSKFCQGCGTMLTQQAQLNYGQQTMQKPQKKKTPIVIIIVAVFAFLLFFCVIGSLFWSDSDNEKSETEVKTEDGDIDGNDERDSDENDISEDEIEKTLIEGKQKLATGKYHYITNEDLSKYIANMSGAKIYVVGEFGDINENALQLSITEGFAYSEFDCGDRIGEYEKVLKEDDIVAVLGTVKKADKHLFGKSIKLEKCYLFAIGEEAEKYKEKKSDKKLKKYMKVTEDVADDGVDVSEDEYKKLCKVLDYESILRDPDSYNGKYCKVSGTVSQVVEGWFDSFTIYVEDSNGNKWGCIYSYKDGEKHVLEGDSITAYGKCEGTENVDNIMGKQVTMPKVNLEYIK